MSKNRFMRPDTLYRNVRYNEENGDFVTEGYSCDIWNLQYYHHYEDDYRDDINNWESVVYTSEFTDRTYVPEEDPWYTASVDCIKSDFDKI